MRIIKTITCHDVYNYGASLQAYALMKYLEELGHDVEIIDYKPDFLNKRYKLFEVSQRYRQNIFFTFIYLFFKVPIRLMNRSRKYAFDKFTKSHLRRTTKCYGNNTELKVNPPYADIYFTGSDQVWNTYYPNGKDPAFYLDFAPDKSIKASYAASFSTDSIVKEYEKFVKEKISALNYISVREIKGIEILKSIGINRGELVLDPVFLLNKQHWFKMVSKPQVESYILIYDFENNPLIQVCSKLIQKRTGLKLVAINDWFENPYADINIKNAGPEKFLSLIAYSEIFLSNSFHGTAFSIIFGKKFYAFKRIRDGVNSRIIDLLKIVGLLNRLIVSENDIHLKNAIDYNAVQKKLDPIILKSKEYLHRVITTIGNN
jgi:hypothetical protein